MSDSEPGAPTTVGVVGPGGESIADLVAAAGGDPLVGDPGAVTTAGVDAAVAVGDRAARDVVLRAPDLPVLAVDAAPGLPTVDRSACPDAVERLLAGEWTLHERTVFEVLAGDETASALLDATLMTADPARISEYTVGTDAGTVGSFRSDGVVVATPAGSRGYANSAGGPTLAPAVEAAVVVPVAPFAIDQDRWVLDLPISLSVERDENPVDLYVDGERVREIDTGTPVSVRRNGAATFVAVPERAPRFG